MDKVTLIGIAASALSATSLIPQLIKILKERDAQNVSLFMLVVLICGLGLWIYYGALKGDLIIIISNSFAFLVNLATLILAYYFKRQSS